MENKINIAKILKDCPKGMELDCTIWDNVVLDHIDMTRDCPIYIRIKGDGYEQLTKYGQWNHSNNAKCVIFPKGKTTWEGFQRPFKDGDVVVAEDDEHFQLFLLKDLTHSEDYSSYNGYCYFGWNFQCNKLFEKGKWRFNRLATEKEKEKLFQVIKDNGYKWNPKTNTLEKLVEPRFKVGDRIKAICNNNQYDIKELTDTHYTLVEVKYKFKYTEPISEDKKWELVPSKFDISTLIPFESKVLVRSLYSQVWSPAIYGFKHFSMYMVVGGISYCQCIPYEGNEHLLGTTDDCDKFYKNW